MKKTNRLLKEAQEKHREIKKDLLEIMSTMGMQNITKEKIKDELFKLYQKIK